MKITVCTIAINSWYRDIVRYSIKNTEEYCKKHNYNFVLVTEESDLVFDKLKHPAWYKMQLIRSLIKSNESDYIVWIDADSQILNRDQNLEYFLQKYIIDTGKDLALVRENPLNTGVMFIKSSEYNYNLMEQIWNNKNEYDRNFWDQASFVEIYQRDEDVRNHTYVIEFVVQDELVCYWSRYYPNRSFLMHMARCSHDTLDFLYMMDSYYKDKLDEESEEQYQERLRWLNTYEICRNDIDRWVNNEYVPRLYSQRCLNYKNLKYLIHWFPFCSGGLCDRILGLSANLCISKVLNRKLLIRWDHGEIKPNLDVHHKYNYYNHNIPFKHINLTNLESITYFRNVNINEEWKDDNTMIWSNVNLYNYLLQNPYFQHLRTRDFIKDISEAIREVLFRYLTINPKLFEDYTQYDVGIHIRTGDKQIYNKENEEFYRDYITDIFTKIKKEGSIKPDQTVFISSDCLLAYKIAEDFFDNFNYNKGDIVHIAIEGKVTESGMYKVLLDLLTLCNCKSMLYLGWDSNFSRIAALFNPKRRFICYEYENNKDAIKDISNELLFSYHSNGKYT